MRWLLGLRWSALFGSVLNLQISPAERRRRTVISRQWVRSVVSAKDVSRDRNREAVATVRPATRTSFIAAGALTVLNCARDERRILRVADCMVR